MVLLKLYLSTEGQNADHASQDRATVISQTPCGCHNSCSSLGQDKSGLRFTSHQAYKCARYIYSCTHCLSKCTSVKQQHMRRVEPAIQFSRCQNSRSHVPLAWQLCIHRRALSREVTYCCTTQLLDSKQKNSAAERKANNSHVRNCFCITVQQVGLHLKMRC